MICWLYSTTLKQFNIQRKRRRGEGDGRERGGEGERRGEEGKGKREEGREGRERKIKRMQKCKNTKYNDFKELTLSTMESLSRSTGT